MKRILKKSDDPYLALLSYRATPLQWCNLSQSELLMGRRLRTTLPQTSTLLIPRWPYLPEFKRADKDYKSRTRANFDRRHRVVDLPEIPVDQDVWVSSDGDTVPRTVVSRATTPRSYIVCTPSGEISRNRSQLRVMPETAEPESRANTETDDSQSQPRSSPIMTRSRTGVDIRPPDRLS